MPATAHVRHLSTLDKVIQFFVELTPPLIVALLISPRAMSPNPAQRPFLMDVYRMVGARFIPGKDYYTIMSNRGIVLEQPPLVGALSSPLAMFGLTFTHVLWLALLVFCLQFILARAGLPRGWPLAAIGALVVLGAEPVRDGMTLGAGTVIVVALIVADLIPQGWAQGRPHRRAPAGLGIGTAAAISLYPALIIAFLLVIGRRKWAGRATAWAVLMSVVGSLFSMVSARSYWGSFGTRVAGVDSPGDGSNQSLLGALQHWGLLTSANQGVAWTLFALVALVGVLAAAERWVAGDRVTATAMLGLASLLAWPSAWNHQFVWVLLLIVGLWVSAGRSSLPYPAAAALWIWGLWLLLGIGSFRSAQPMTDVIIATGGAVLGFVTLTGLALRAWLGHLPLRDV